jgi:CheY-like chemotaxis protein
MPQIRVTPNEPPAKDKYAVAMKKPLDILIADDNPDDVFLLRQAFRKAGVKHNLQAVADGQQAVAYLEGKGEYADRAERPFPDVLLLDLNMPNTNGFEVLKWVRQNAGCSRLIVHVVTASCRESDIEMAYFFRANSFVVKPTRLVDLIGFVTALDHWHQFAALPPKPEPNSAASSRAEQTCVVTAV